MAKKRERPKVNVIIKNPEMIPIARDRLTIALIKLQEENQRKLREKELNETY